MDIMSLQLPMGTIMVVCMLLALLFTTRLPVINVLQKSPALLRWPIAGVVLLAGLWNVFWYALRHLTEFWGIAALVSGLLMLIAAAYIAINSGLPAWLQKVRPVILLLLTACMLLYAITIFRL